MNDATARRHAKRVGLLACRSRWRRDTCDNHGGFQIIHPLRNWDVAGDRFQLTADQVIAFCQDVEAKGHVRIAAR